MKKLTLVLGLFLCFACSKEEPVNEQQHEDRIILDNLKISNEGIRLSWSKLINQNFQSYEILRSESNQTDYYQRLEIISNSDNTDYIDIDAPYSPYVSYKIIGHLSNGSQSAIQSNIQEYSRPSIFRFEGNIDQVIPQFEKNRIYLIDLRGKISIMDIERELIVNTLETFSQIGYVDIQQFNDTTEIYVPRYDGWVYIYNAETFELIERIDTGRASSSIIFNKDKLFVSTDAWTQKPLKVYNRNTLELIEESGDFDLTRLRLIPETDTELLEITLNIGPVDQDYYYFDTNGYLIEHKNDRYHGDFDLDANIFSFFPNHDKFITGSNGAIYSREMKYLSRLPQGYLNFSSFGFDSPANLIYAGCSNERSIQKYNLNDYSRQGFIKTGSFPKYLIKNGQTMFIIGLSSNTGNASFVFEKINL